MAESTSANLVCWHVLIIRRNASELLVFEAAEAECFLPAVEIPMYSRTAQELNAQIKARWEVDVYSLYEIQWGNTSSTLRYHLVEALHPDAPAPPSGCCWVSVRDACRLCFAEGSDAAAVQAWIGKFATKQKRTNHPPFDKPGWFRVVKEFVQDAIRCVRLRLTGEYLQLNASPYFSLIRFTTDGEAVWFKATGEPNTREFLLTALLSSRLLVSTPRVLATQPHWNAWVMSEIAGVSLAGTDSLLAWCTAAGDLARMQIASSEMARDISKCAPRDLRASALLSKVRPFFVLMREWMERQTKTSPARLSQSELEQLECDTQDGLLALQQERIPNTLGHLDLNPDNVIAGNAGTVFLDWAEGYIGHPFLSFAQLLEYFLRTFGPGASAARAFIRAYLEPWEPFLASRALEPTLATCMFLAIFAHAVSNDVWRDDRALLNPTTAGYYRSLARRMKRYRDRARDGIYGVSETFA